MRAKRNTRDLITFLWYPVSEDRRRSDGTNLGTFAAGCTDYRLHQLGRGGAVVSPFDGGAGAGRQRQEQPPPARPAGARGGLLRRSAGALHAGLLPRGAALLAGRVAVAPRTARAAARGQPLGDLPSPHQTGLGAARATARRAATSPGEAQNQRRFLPSLAADLSGRQHLGCGR